MRLKLKLITFDFGDTLVSADPPYLTRIWMALKDLGIKKSQKEVERAYHIADFKVAKRLLEEKNFNPELYQMLLGTTLLEELGIKENQQELLTELAEWLLGFRPERVIVPGADKVLEELKSRNYILGIISNNDGRTHQKCQEVGIEKYFDFILDSTIEGMIKPDPKFFQKALELGRANPSETLHIGDLWGSDVLGARASGLWAVWVENEHISPHLQEKVFKIKNIEQVLELIE